MSNTTVRAAAEGMPKIKTDALTIIPLIDEFRAAHNRTYGSPREIPDSV